VALVLLAGALALVRRRRPGTRSERPLRVEDREALGRDSGVALVRAGADRLLVGWGRDGVRLVARLGADGKRP
jgi:flagellar biogenesis protein FliO